MKFKNFLALFSFLCLCSPFCMGGMKMETESVPFSAGDRGVHTYRIPALCFAADGSLLAFAEARRNHLGDDGVIDLVVRRSTDGGATWGDTVVVASDGESTFGNPVPVLEKKSGKIIMLITQTPKGMTERKMAELKDRYTRPIYVCESSDNGKSWSAPRNITEELGLKKGSWYATGPGGGIQVEGGIFDGRIVVPIDTTADGIWRSGAVFSDDFGATWKLGEWAPFPAGNECQLAQLGDSLVLNMRVQGGYKDYGTVRTRQVAISRDFGGSWEANAPDGQLIESICQGSFISFMKNGEKLLAFSNPAAASRKNMTLRIGSQSDYLKWFENGCPAVQESPLWKESISFGDKKAAYSALAAFPDGSIAMLYECGEKNPYARIKFVRVRLN